MTAPPIWGVVPVKPLHLAKGRLAWVLGPAARAALAAVMLDDVLTAMAASRHLLQGILVVTADAEVAALARTRGALVLLEAAPTGLNDAILRGAARVVAMSGAGMVVIPADLPHISPPALAEVVALIERPRAVAVVRAETDNGTNILACRPADVIRPGFGPGSFDRHCRAARREGVTPGVPLSTHLGRDLDRPADLEAFLRLGSATRTHAYLSRLTQDEFAWPMTEVGR